MYFRGNNYFIIVIIIIILIKNPFKKLEEYFSCVYYFRKNKSMKVFLTIVLVMSTSLKHIFLNLLMRYLYWIHLFYLWLKNIPSYAVFKALHDAFLFEILCLTM